MRVRPFIISILLVLILVMFNRVFLNTFNRANSYFATETLYSNEDNDSNWAADPESQRLRLGQNSRVFQETHLQKTRN